MKFPKLKMPKWEPDIGGFLVFMALALIVEGMPATALYYGMALRSLLNFVTNKNDHG